MPTSTNSSESVRVSVSSRSSIVDSMQEITLRTALNRAIGSVANCFDNCNRQAEPGSMFSQQAEACGKNYAAVDNHKTTLVYTGNLTKHLIHSGLDYLKGATDAALNTGPVVRWSSLSLTRSLIEASADCLWLADPTLDLDARLRRTSQMFVRACDEMLRMLPDAQETTSRFLSIDPVAKDICLEARDSALKWAKAQGWTCANGKTITRNRWIREIPSHKEMVALAGQEEPDYWKDVYSMLSGTTHSQPLLMTLSLKDEPDSHLDRALMVLDIGISFYTDALRQFAEFMGWHDHDIDNWFVPVHLAIQHIRTPEDIPLPRFELERCEVCPDYQSPSMHRLALMSHLYALLERNVNREGTSGTDAPNIYSSAVEFIVECQKMLKNGNDEDPKTQELRTALGTNHISVLSLFGIDPNEFLTSIAASWAILRSPDYQSAIGKIQGWMSRTDDQSPAVPYGND